MAEVDGKWGIWGESSEERDDGVLSGRNLFPSPRQLGTDNAGSAT